MQHPTSLWRLVRNLSLLVSFLCAPPLASTHPLGPLFQASGYTAGKEMIDREGFNYIPAGVLGQVGLTLANQPNNALGQTVITQNGAPEAYSFAGQVATKLRDFTRISYEYQVGNTHPGWKGSAGRVAMRNSSVRWRPICSRSSRLVTKEES